MTTECLIITKRNVWSMFNFKCLTCSCLNWPASPWSVPCSGCVPLFMLDVECTGPAWRFDHSMVLAPRLDVKNSSELLNAPVLFGGSSGLDIFGAVLPISCPLPVITFDSLQLAILSMFALPPPGCTCCCCLSAQTTCGPWTPARPSG